MNNEQIPYIETDRIRVQSIVYKVDPTTYKIVERDSREQSVTAWGLKLEIPVTPILQEYLMIECDLWLPNSIENLEVFDFHPEEILPMDQRGVQLSRKGQNTTVSNLVGLKIDKPYKPEEELILDTASLDIDEDQILVEKLAEIEKKVKRGAGFEQDLVGVETYLRKSGRDFDSNAAQDRALLYAESVFDKHTQDFDWNQFIRERIPEGQKLYDCIRDLVEKFSKSYGHWQIDANIKRPFSQNRSPEETLRFVLGNLNISRIRSNLRSVLSQQDGSKKVIQIYLGHGGEDPPVIAESVIPHSDMPIWQSYGNRIEIQSLIDDTEIDRQDIALMIFTNCNMQKGALTSLRTPIVSISGFSSSESAHSGENDIVLFNPT